MDFYSGSVPRNQISFRLGMSSPERHPSSNRTNSQIVPKLSQEDQYHAPNSVSLAPALLAFQSSGSSGDDVNLYAFDYISRKVVRGGEPTSGNCGEANSEGIPSSVVVDTSSKSPTRICHGETSTIIHGESEVIKSAGQLQARTSPSFNTIMRDILDSDSDVLILGECIKMPSYMRHHGPLDDSAG